MEHDDGTSERWLEHATRRLGEAGMRAGAARTAVVELLAREGHCLLTAAEVTERLRDAEAGSAATAYRVMNELFALGLLHRVDGRDGVARFEIADPDPAVHHHHLVDEETGRTEPFADAGLEAAIAAVAARFDFELTGHDVVLRGRRRDPTAS